MFYVLAMVSQVCAAEPSEPTITSDGTVLSNVFVEADAAAVRQLIADPVALAKLNPDVLSARVLSHGECDMVEVTTKGMSSPLSYVVKRCPTAGGFSETLVSSEDFSAVAVSWKLESVPGGTNVSYSIRTSPDLPVPQRVISSFTAKSAVTALKNLVHRVTGQ